MKLLRDMGHVESPFRHGFAPNVPQAQELFWTHPMLLQGDETKVEAQFGLFRDSANL